jgi:hypothetical protein
MDKPNDLSSSGITDGKWCYFKRWKFIITVARPRPEVERRAGAA